MALFVSVLVYVLSGYDITAEKVFVLTSFYNVLRQTMTVFFPQGIAQVAEARMSVKRLNTFMLFGEIQSVKSSTFNEKQADGDKSADLSKSSNGIEKSERRGELRVFLTNATAKWSEMSVDNTLTNINIKVRKFMSIINMFCIILQRRSEQHYGSINLAVNCIFIGFFYFIFGLA